MSSTVTIRMNDLKHVYETALEQTRKDMVFSAHIEVVEKGCWWKFKKSVTKLVPLEPDEHRRVVSTIYPFTEFRWLNSIELGYGECSRYSEVRVSASALADLSFFTKDRSKWRCKYV